MHMISISEAKAKLTELARIADDEPVLLLRNSKPAAVILSHDRYEALLEQLEDAEDALAIAQDQLNPEATISLEQLKADLAIEPKTA